MVTSDLTPLEQAGAAPLYACVLNAQGRFLHDMFLHRVEGEMLRHRATMAVGKVQTPRVPLPLPLYRPADAAVPTLLLDIDIQGKEDLLRLLKRYRLRLRIDIDDVSAIHSVCVRFGSSGGSSGGSGSGSGNVAGGWPADPRLPALGLRAVLPRDQALSSSSSSAPVNWQAYQRWRVLQGVAEGCAEIPSGERKVTGACHVWHCCEAACCCRYLRTTNMQMLLPF